MGSATLYQIVGCAPDATSDEVRKAYYRGALKCHPDKHPDDSEAHVRFIQLGRAFSVLSDDAQRAQYDTQLLASRAETAKAAAPNQRGGNDCQWASQWRSYSWRAPEPRENNARAPSSENPSDAAGRESSSEPSRAPQGTPRHSVPPKSMAVPRARCFPQASAFDHLEHSDGTFRSKPNSQPAPKRSPRAAASDPSSEHALFRAHGTVTVNRDELAAWKR